MTSSSWQVASWPTLLIAIALVAATFGIVISTANAQTQEYYVAVAVNSTNTEYHPFHFVWAFGYHTDSGSDAQGEARRLCNTHGGGTCWPLGIPSNRGGCVALVQGGWIDQGEPQVARLFAGTSAWRHDAETYARQSCETYIFSGKASGTVAAWRCNPVGSYCSPNVTH